MANLRPIRFILYAFCLLEARDEDGVLGPLALFIRVMDVVVWGGNLKRFGQMVWPSSPKANGSVRLEMSGSV